MELDIQRFHLNVTFQLIRTKEILKKNKQIKERKENKNRKVSPTANLLPIVRADTTRFYPSLNQKNPSLNPLATDLRRKKIQ